MRVHECVSEGGGLGWGNAMAGQREGAGVNGGRTASVMGHMACLGRQEEVQLERCQ